MFDHLSVGVSDLARSATFYDAALSAFGWVRLLESARAVCYGPAGYRGEPPFAVLVETSHATVESSVFHLAFRAADCGQVDAFHEAAIASGGSDDGPPGIRERYHAGYYAAFVRDPDGHRLEAVHHIPQPATGGG